MQQRGGRYIVTLATLGLALGLPATADLAPDISIISQPDTKSPYIYIFILLGTAALSIFLTLALEFPWYFFGLGKAVRPLRRVVTWLVAHAVRLPLIFILAIFLQGWLATIFIAEAMIVIIEAILIRVITKKVSWGRALLISLAANLTSAVVGTVLLHSVTGWLY